MIVLCVVSWNMCGLLLFGCGCGVVVFILMKLKFRVLSVLRWLVFLFSFVVSLIGLGKCKLNVFIGKFVGGLVIKCSSLL